MAHSELNVEMLLSRRVYALNGRNIGRIEEVRAEWRGSECVVTEYLVGVYAVFERLSGWRIGRAVLRLLPAKRGAGYRVPWNQLDLADPERPRLRCSVEELVRLEEQP